MDTQTNVYLTDMSQALSRDYSGTYRKKQLDISTAYKNQMQALSNSDKGILGIKQALQHAETILMME